jgi:hypothetical protein
MSPPGIQIIWDIISVPLMLYSGSIFPHASNFAVHGGNYYAARHITLHGENSLC